MPSFAELKAKAAGMTSAGVEKIQNARDRTTSVPLAKTNWDPHNGPAPPPPPPPRGAVNSSTKPLAHLLPPPRRTSTSLPTSPDISRTSSVSPAPPPLPFRSTPPLPPRHQSATPPAQPRFPLQTKPISSFSGPPPPLIQRSTRPDAHSRQQTPVEPEIDWANLSPEDKEVFFGWLDEFFVNYKAKMSDTSPQPTSHHNLTSSATKLSSWTRSHLSGA